MLNSEIRTELFRMVADITYISPKVVYSSYGDSREFIKIGMTPMQAIQAGTIVNAQLLHKEKEIGSIEVGKWAGRKPNY